MNNNYTFLRLYSLNKKYIVLNMIRGFLLLSTKNVLNHNLCERLDILLRKSVIWHQTNCSIFEMLGISNCIPVCIHTVHSIKKLYHNHVSRTSINCFGKIKYSNCLN